MTTAVVTGGFGYAGGRIAQELLDAGTDVRVSTRRDAAAVPAWAEDRVIWGADLDALADGADCLIHLAAPNEVECAQDPDAAVETTVRLTDSALRAAAAAGVRRFIYLSTVHVYGPMRGRINEDTPPNPQHPYAVAHLESERAVDAASGRFDAIVFRLSNGYGAPAGTGTDRWSLLVNDLCRQAVRDHRLQLSSNGLQQRDFLPLSDVAGAIRHFAQARPHTNGRRLFNLSSGRSMPVIEMAGLIRKRAEAVLGTEIGFDVPGDGPPAPTEALVIENQRLLGAGFRPSADAVAEIDGMLRFCIDTCGSAT